MEERMKACGNAGQVLNAPYIMLKYKPYNFASTAFLQTFVALMQKNIIKIINN